MQADNQLLLATGSLLGQRYELQQPLGAGGMGWVFRASDTRLNGQVVALKFLYPHLVSDGTAFSRFRNEVLVARKLIHPHIVRTYTFDTDAGHAYIVMEYVDGRTVRDLLQKDYPEGMPYAQAVDIALSIAVGMHHSHSSGIIHRDLKPDNIMLSAAGEIKLSDFGLAATLRRQGQLTRCGQLLGTPYYMAPEQFRAETLDTRVDIYAFGILLYELLLGRVPFTDDSLYALARKHEQEELTIPESRRCDSPDALWEIIQRATRKNPDERFSCFVEVVRALDQVCDNALRLGLTSAVTPEAEVKEPLKEPQPYRLKRLFTPRILLLDFLLFLVVGIVWTRNNTSIRIRIAVPILLAEQALDIRLTTLRNLLAITGELGSGSLADTLGTEIYPAFSRLWAGDDPNAERNRTATGDYGLHVATRLSNLKALRLLLKCGADPNLTAHNGTSPLHIAAANHDLESAQVLLDSTALPDIVAANGDTPLLVAAQTRDVAIAMLLLRVGADPLRRDSVGFSTLMYAVKHGEIGLFKAAIAKIPQHIVIDEEALIGLAPEAKEDAVRSLLAGRQISVAP